MRAILLCVYVLIGGTVLAQHKAPILRHKKPHLILPKILLQMGDSMAGRRICTRVVNYLDSLPLQIRKPTTTTVDINALTPGYMVNLNEDFFVKRQLEVMPYTSINDASSVATNVYQQKRGAAISSDGGRPGSSLYVVDGIRILEY